MRFIVTVLLAFFTTNSFAVKCYNVTGVVTLEPVLHDGETNALGCAFEHPYSSDYCITTQQQVPSYLRTKGIGNVIFKGVSELTTVTMEGVGGSFANTPLSFPFDEARSDLGGFTSQTILKTKFRDLRGTLYTKDSGYITSLENSEMPGFGGEVLRIVGGDGDFENAHGIIGVAGQEIVQVFGQKIAQANSKAIYTGKLCLP